MKTTRLFLLTLLAMIAFASNSLLCRTALKQTKIDAASFTFVRIFSGAIALCLITKMPRRLFVDRTNSPLIERSSRSFLLGGDLPAALALFVYAAAFSFAYTRLSAGTGALILFGAVQATMIFWGIRQGERLDVIQIVGLVTALSGLVVLLLPGFSAPPMGGSILMLGAGVAWGIYSLRGRNASDAVATTAGNFLRAVPLAVAVSIMTLRWIGFDRAGLTCAVVSGAITSGLGYVIWYRALADLKATSAATVQLSVPVLAAAGGILLLGEPITARYVVASIAVLGGIFLVVIERRHALS